MKTYYVIEHNKMTEVVTVKPEKYDYSFVIQGNKVTTSEGLNFIIDKDYKVHAIIN